MGRKQQHASPMSFFSFQDIMACVTGIMILVTLLLALDPLSNIPMISPTPSPPTELIERLRAARERAAGAMDALARAREVLKQSSVEGRVTGRQMEQFQQVQRAEEQRLAAARMQLEAATARAKKARSEIQLVTRQIEVAGARAAALGKEVAEIELKSRVKRQAGPSEPLRPVLVEVRADGLAIGTLDDAAVPRLESVLPSAACTIAPLVWASKIQQLLVDHPGPAAEGADGWYGLFIIRSDAVQAGLNAYSNLHSRSWDAGCQLWDAAEGGFFDPAPPKEAP